MTVLDDAEREVVAAAALGTARSERLSLALNGPLEAAAMAASRLDSEARLLTTSSLVLAYRRLAIGSGLQPASPLVSPAADEPRAACSAAAAVKLRQMLESRYRPVLNESLELMNSKELRLPFSLLPEFLSLGRSQADLRPSIAKVLGERGVWLANLNPDWHWIREVRTDDDRADQVDLSVWATGARADRIVMMRRLRASSPQAASELIAATWSDEPAALRCELMNLLAAGLSHADETFLEIALADKSSEVRRKAATFLSRLPDSRLSVQSRAYAATLLYSRRSVRGDVQLFVDLPKRYEPEWRSHMIEEAPDIKNVGDRAWWFIQWVGLVSPSVWSDRFGLAAKALIDLAVSSEWEDALLLAWSKGAKLVDDPDWNRALAAYWARRQDLRPTVSSFMPDINTLGPAAQPLIVELMTEDSTPLHDRHRAMRSLLEYHGKWYDSLSRAVIESIRRRMMSTNEANTSTWQTVSLLKVAADRVSSDLYPEFHADWPSPDNQWHEALENFLDVLELRHEFKKELSS